MNRTRTAAALVGLLFAFKAPAEAQPNSSKWADPSPHQVRFVNVAPDVRLEVLDWGGTGEALIFLAGANFNAHSFDDFAPRFTDGYRVFGITRRGHGASTWPDSGYTLTTPVRDIRIVLDSLVIPRAILAGHSLAGDELTRFAADHPDRVAALIYIDAGHDHHFAAEVAEACPFSYADMFPEEARRSVAAFTAHVERMMGFSPPEGFVRTQSRLDDHGRVLGDFAHDSAVRQIQATLPPPGYSGVHAPALGVYHVPEWIEGPTEARASAFQRYVYSGIAAFVEGVGSATVVALQNSHHIMQLASPDELAAAMRRWLSRLRPAR